MPDLTAKRTLVKSPPELWSELSEVERLARHLGAFGEIKITKLEPEHTVAWEGESASGTVSIEPSGWGTKVTLTAQLGDCEESVEEPVASGAGAEEPPAAETAAGEGEQDLSGVGEPEAAEPEAPVEEPSVVEPFPERAETVVMEEPLGEERVAEGPVETAPVAEEPVAEYLFADEPEAAQPVADEPEAQESAVEEPALEERVTPRPAEPVQGRPRRKRGFLAWLFRPRTSVQVAPPTVATPPAATYSEPAGQAPVVEEEPDVVEAPVAVETSVVEETPADEASAPEEPPPPDEPASSVSRATVFDEPVFDQPPAMLEPARVEHETPVVEGHPLMADDAARVSGETPLEAEASPESEEPDLAAELAAAEQASPPPGLDPERAQAILDEALDALGSAHHRPYSRG